MNTESLVPGTFANLPPPGAGDKWQGGVQTSAAVPAEGLCADAVLRAPRGQTETPTVLPADLMAADMESASSTASSNSSLWLMPLPSNPNIWVPELGLCTRRMRGPPIAPGCSTTQVAEYSSLGGLRLAFRGKLVTPTVGSQGFVEGRQSWHCLVLRSGNKDSPPCSG